MYNIILEVTASNGIKSKERVKQGEVVTQENITYYEEKYTDHYQYPDNVNAVVVEIIGLGEQSIKQLVRCIKVPTDSSVTTRVENTQFNNVRYPQHIKRW